MISSLGLEQHYITDFIQLHSEKKAAELKHKIALKLW